MTISLGGIDYPVRKILPGEASENGLRGQFDAEACKVFLGHSLPKTLRAQTMLHEMIHIIEEHYAMKFTEDEVKRLSSGLLGLKVNGRGIIRI